MRITQQVKDSARLLVYNIARHSETNDTYVIFGIGNHMYVLEHSKFNELILSNNYYEKALSYDLDVLINGSYKQDEQYDDIGAEYFVDRILPDYNQDLSSSPTQPYVVYRCPGLREYIVTPQDIFLSSSDDGTPRFEFIGFKYKTNF